MSVLAIQLSGEDKHPSKGDNIKYIYTDSQHKNPLCRVVPVEYTCESNSEEAFRYDKEKYREMILDAAETVLGYFGFDRTVYGNKKSYRSKKMDVATRNKTGKRKRYQNRNDLTMT